MQHKMTLGLLAVLGFGSFFGSSALVHADDGRSDERSKAACSDGVDNDQDGHVDCDDQDCQDFAICAPANGAAGLAPQGHGAARGVATRKLVAGAIMLPLGIVTAASSGAVWWAYSNADYSGNNKRGLMGASIAMDVVGVALIAAGSALLAIGTGDLAATAPEKHRAGIDILPRLAVTSEGAVAGLTLSLP